MMVKQKLVIGEKVYEPREWRKTGFHDSVCSIIVDTHYGQVITFLQTQFRSQLDFSVIMAFLHSNNVNVIFGKKNITTTIQAKSTYSNGEFVAVGEKNIARKSYNSGK